MGHDPYAPADDPRSTSYTGPPAQSWWDDPELTVIDTGPPNEGAEEETIDLREGLTDGDTVSRGSFAEFAYSAEDVPTNAADVVAWIKDAEGDDENARAVAALAVERERPKMRTTVVDAIEAATGSLIGDA